MSGIGRRQKIGIKPSPALDLVQNEWNFVEVWIDLMFSRPYILLLLDDLAGNCRVYDPVENYKVVFTSAT